MFKSCLICTDLSDGLDRLLNFVPELAQNGLEQIVFFHNVPLWEQGDIPRIDREKVAAAEAYLSQVEAKAPSGVEVKVEVLSGRAVDTIPRVLETYQSEVVILGTPIRNLLQEKIFGSTSMGLAKSISKPMVVLRPQLISTYTKEELSLRAQHLWRYLLVPYHDTPAGNNLIAEIKNLAHNRPENSFTHCLLLWIVEDVQRRDLPLDYKVQEAEEKLAVVKTELEDLGLQVETQVRQGNPLQQVLEAAVTYDITCIAVAKSYSNQLLEWTVPSFANEVLHKSWFPVLFFSPPK